MLIPLSTASLATLAERFEIVDAHDAAARERLLATHGAQIRAVLTNGTTGIRTAEIERLPHLELIAALGRRL